MNTQIQRISSRPDKMCLLHVMRLLVILALIFAALPAPAARAASSILRVTPTGINSLSCGNTWAHACGMQYALTGAETGDEIWVAAGVYVPTTTSERMA